MATSQQLAAFNYAVPGPPVWNPVRSASFNAVAGNAYPVNTTSAAVTVTLPASPVIGQAVQIVDYAGTFATNACIVARNGSKIAGQAANAILTVNRESLSFVYIDSTQGWIAYSAFIATNIGQSYTASYLIVAGGGGGGGYYGGGGGAGGLLTSSSYSVSPTNVITVTVGAGGAGGVGQSAQGVNGTNSTIVGSTTITVYGGGGGGVDFASAGKNGGSGGGTSLGAVNPGVGVYPGST